MVSPDRPILIAGGGVAGLTAALTLAAEGFPVRLFEAAQEFGEVGAGLQLSPNATHILRRLGVLEHLLPHAVAPTGVVLRDATTLRQLTEIPLTESAARYGAPYLVAHRAAIQQALLAAVKAQPAIIIEKDAQVLSAEFGTDDVTLTLSRDGSTTTIKGAFLVGADGVWSSLRRFVQQDQPVDSVFSGMTAWRTTIDRGTAEALGLSSLIRFDKVSTFLDPKAHLVAYPISAGKALNLVAITRGTAGTKDWSQTDGQAALTAFLSRLGAPLQHLSTLTTWTRWPLYSAPAGLKWTARRLVLTGDAAHAMLPFAAQGAAMAIEDAAVLASLLGQHRTDLERALPLYEAERRPRIDRLLARGKLNRMAWHAAGPIAFGRDMVLRLKGPQSLARDLDWLYGWKEPREQR
ncbi:FAD-dependent monooxygenase [Tianweitania sp. BSSL-BM11]|uniref:FAD-dependent monooxygenase n=1 Tax=Tianweitania aestuarii TaxID=2814886 RepID=A0ABS5RUW7_9HYPH|nr:FAD-dependent monooxygenase [Tianweitania aestuarii]MBS9720076.1 FAD-dependent monooxygenase [Tianweitania aestuarii]